MRRQTERLLNLLIALRAAEGWVDRDRLRRSITDYRELDDAAFDRQFTRDKQALADLGITIRTAEHGDPFTGDAFYGYRIDESDYALTQIDFTPEEAALVSVSRALLEDTALAGEAGTALNKLRGLGAGFSAPEAAAPAVPAALPSTVASSAFASLLRALEARRAVSFSYRRPGAAPARRTLEPYALLTRADRSYVMGRDLDRDAVRSFRLSRIGGTVARVPGRRDGDYAIPTGFRAGDHFLGDGSGQRTAGADPAVRCELAVAPGRALPLREAGVRIGSDADAGAHGFRGWERWELEVSHPERFAHRLLEYTPHVRVLAPQAIADRHKELLARSADLLDRAAGQATGGHADG